MKKYLFILPLLASLLFTACSSDDDEVAKSYNVTVTVTGGDDIVLNDVTDLTVKVINTKTSKEQTATATAGSAALVLSAGTYDFQVTGKYKDHDISGVSSNVTIGGDYTVPLTIKYAAVNSSLIFKEVYFSGVKSYYFKDAFYEIYNNSDQTQYLDGVILGVVDDGLPVGTYTPANSIWVDGSGSLLSSYPMYSFTMYFPGSGTEHPLEPGKSVVVAVSAINHSARTLSSGDVQSPVDLSKANWEMYVQGKTVTLTDNPDIPNLEFAYKNMGIQFMPSTSGEAVILAKLPTGVKITDFLASADNFKVKPGTSLTANLMIPSDYVIDAIDIVRAPATERYKHLLTKDDLGQAWVDGSSNGSLQDAAYSGKSLRRKVSAVVNGRSIYKDTNNSSVDFIKGGSTPTPGIISTTVDE